MTKVVAPNRTELRPVRPNAGLTAAYRKKLDDELHRMQKDVLRTLRLAWADDPPVLASDESPAAALRAAIGELRRRWTRGFNDLARNYARKWTGDVTGHADRSFSDALRKAGFTVRFKMTEAAQDVFTATVAEQVALIRSIPAELLTQVEGHVMRSVQAGRDVGYLAKAVEEQFGVSRRRAALIARDQNNKATATVTMVRQRELGITRARWLHSAGGKVPRPSHLKAGREGAVYDVDKGWWDPDEKEFIYPGQLINCRCVSVSLVPGIDG